MPEAKPREYAVAWIAKFALGLFRLMSLDKASAFGGWLVRMIGPWIPAHRTADANLQLAMPELTVEQRRGILRGMWDNLGRVLAEYAYLADIRSSIRAGGGRTVVVGSELLDAIRESGEPVIFFSAHYGNWELMSIVATDYGLPLVHVYRAANNPLTEEILRELRKPVGGRHIPKGMQAAREMVKALKQKESLGILMDQRLSAGMAVPFFGHPAMTAPAIVELALRAGCPLVPAYVERLGGARFRVTVEPPVRLKDTGDRERDIYNALAMINGRIEAWVRLHPDHWFWVHKRWKM